MKYEEAVEQLEKENPSAEACELASDALAFAASLHQCFLDSGLTKNEEVDFNELENLFDGVHGELGAACLFLSAKGFERVPDMLRVVGQQLEKQQDANVVPTAIKKGFERLAKRLENTRVNAANLVQSSEVAADNSEKSS